MKRFNIVSLDTRNSSATALTGWLRLSVGINVLLCVAMVLLATRMHEEGRIETDLKELGIGDGKEPRMAAESSAPFDSLGDGERSDTEIQSIIQYYLGKDQLGQLAAAIDSIADLGIRMQVLAILFDTPQMSEQEAALRMSELFTSSQCRRISRSIIIAKVADTSPREALHLATTIGADAKLTHFNNIFRKWAKKSPREAFLAWEMLPDSTIKDRVRSTLFESWAENDSGSLVAWAISEAPDGERDRALYAGMLRLAATDLDQSLTMLQQMQSGDVKTDVLTQIIGSLTAPTKIDQLISWVSMLPEGQLRAEALSQLVPKIASYDLGTAASLVNEMPDGYLRSRALRLLGSELSSVADRGAAVQSLTEYFSATDIADVNSAVVARWALDDPVAALRYARGGTFGNVTENENMVFMQWSSRSPAGLIEWALESGNSGALTTEVATTALAGLASSNPAGAALILEANPELFDDKLNQAKIVAGTWARKDPLRASEWVLAIAESDVKEGAVGSLAENWLAFDSFNASRWISKLDSGDIRDRAVAALVKHEASSNPNAAIEWASSVSNKDLKVKMIADVIVGIPGVSVQAAAELLATGKLDATTVDRATDLVQERLGNQ